MDDTPITAIMTLESVSTSTRYVFTALHRNDADFESNKTSGLYEGSEIAVDQFVAHVFAMKSCGASTGRTTPRVPHHAARLTYYAATRTPENIRMSANIAATRGGASWRPLDMLLWCVQAVLALVFVNASWAKLTGNPEMVALFTAVDVGQWFRYVTGILELTGAVLILLPKTRRVGAALLATIMLGALSTHLFILHVPPTAPIVLLVLSAVVVWGRR